jgi:hypothetical protein
VKETGCDSLAVAIGNSHGAYKFKGEQHLDLERLKLIKKALMDAGLGDYPLVLHGASSVPKDLVEEINKYGGKMGPTPQGVPEADIEVARRTGCTKVNIDTDLRLAMTAGIRKVFAENPKEFDPRKYLGPARTAVKDLVRHKVATCSAAPVTRLIICSRTATPIFGLEPTRVAWRWPGMGASNISPWDAAARKNDWCRPARMPTARCGFTPPMRIWPAIKTGRWKYWILISSHRRFAGC